jgi:hypothetical protein
VELDTGVARDHRIPIADRVNGKQADGRAYAATLDGNRVAADQRTPGRKNGRSRHQRQQKDLLHVHVLSETELQIAALSAKPARESSRNGRFLGVDKAREIRHHKQTVFYLIRI